MWAAVAIVVAVVFAVAPSADARPRWTSPLPQGNDLAAVWSDGEVVLAAGAKGTVVRGAVGSDRLELLATGTTRDLRGGCAVGKEHYVVGDGGFAARSVDGGKSWQAIATGVTEDLYAIWGLGTGLIAVGDRGVVLRSPDKGATWSRIDVGGGERLLGVWGTGRQIYVVGETGTALRSTDGALRFVPLEAPDEPTWVTVAGRGDDVYLLGRSGTVAHSPDKGKTWAVRRRGRAIERAGLAVSPAGEVIVVGGGRSQRSNDQGKTWTEQPAPAPADVVAAWTDGKDVFAAGEDGVILRDARLLSPGSRELLDDVVGWGKERWAVGAAGTLLRAADGTRWETVSSPVKTSLYALAGTPEELYVVGDRGTILRGNGAGFTALESGVTVQLEDVLVLSPDDVLVVGFDQILRSRDHGKTWSAENHPKARDLNGVTGSAGGLWIVGDGGVVLTSRGDGKWEQADAGTRADLAAVWSQSSKNVWVAGTDTVLRWDGDSWRELNVPRGAYRAIAGNDRGAIAIGAEDGRVLVSSDNGKTWKLSIALDASIEALWYAPNGDLSIAGAGGSLLEGQALP
jgi:photosystem II stability/assembly factor-like uncharacterized protein